MSATVVPTRATTRLAKAMIARAKREESGAEAAIVHYDDVDPDQMAALLGLLLDAAREPRVTVQKVECAKCVRPCRECGEEKRITAHGMCNACYQRLRVTRTQAPCVECGETRRPHSHGRCHACYQRERRKAIRAQESDNLEQARKRGAA